MSAEIRRENFFENLVSCIVFPKLFVEFLMVQQFWFRIFWALVAIFFLLFFRTFIFVSKVVRSSASRLRGTMMRLCRSSRLFF